MTISKLKEAQLAVILKHNPMRDDYHIGIRKLSDIKTFAEVVNDDESFVYGDFSQQDALNALKTGKITVYSSKGINLGDFVSTSRRMAQDYAGYSGRVYQRTVNLTDVAWINGDEGVYTGPIKLKEDKIMSIKIESAQVLSEKLEANLIALASKYHPEGVIKITPDITMTGAFTAVYTPAPQDYSPLVIRVVGGEIEGIGKRFGEETDPRIAKLKNAFNEAKKRAIAKQTQKPVQAPVQHAPAKPAIELPAVLNRSEFNNLDLPKSAIQYVTGAAFNKNKVYITVQYAITHETSTHYIVLSVGVGGSKHRLQGKSAEELVSKLGGFIGIPNLNSRPVRQGSYMVANVQQIAEYLAKVATVK